MKFVLAWLLWLVPTSVVLAGLDDSWGVLGDYAKRTWTTAPSASPRLTLYRWEVPGKVLVASHGFASMRQSLGDRFADTVQRMELDAADGTIRSTYTYTDGRPPLRSRMRILPDGSVLEEYEDASGSRFRNTYSSADPRTSLIKRERLESGSWVGLPTTTRHGTSPGEAEQERLAALDQAKRDNAANERSYQEMQAARAEANEQQRQREDEATAFYSSNGLSNPAQVLTDLANSVNAQTKRDREAFEQRVSGTANASTASPADATGASSPVAAPAAARRTMYSWCWATTGSRASYMSPVGSRQVSVDEQQAWRSAMESEFRQQLRGAVDTVQCDIDTDSDFGLTRSSVSADSPVQVSWAPH